MLLDLRLPGDWLALERANEIEVNSLASQTE